MREEERADGAAGSSRGDPLREPWPDPDDDVREGVRPPDEPFRARAVAAVAGAVRSPPWRPPVRRVEAYWRWFAAVLFVVVPLDMVTTMYAAEAVGIAGEANPVVRVAIEHGVLAYAGLNLAAVAVAVGGFWALARVVRADESAYVRYVEVGLALWLGLLLAAGLLVLANNLAVVVHGRSLVG